MTAPATIPPQAARDRLKADAESIARTYKSPLARREALNHAIKRLKDEYPNAFRPEPIA